MSYSPIGDTIALTKLAYALYSQVILVARNAPEQFDDLQRDLDIYKRVLYRIRRQAEHDDGDPSYSDNVQDVLKRCFHTLYGLRDLTSKYENFAWSDRGLFFQRLFWAKDQDPIRGFRDKIKEDQQLLQLILTSDGRKKSREILSEEVQHVPSDNDEKTPISRRGSEIGPVCACCISPVKRTITTATTDSETLLNSREFPSTSPSKVGSSGYKKFREKRLSSTASTAQETLESSTLKSRSYSVSTTKTSFSSSHEQSQSDGLGIDLPQRKLLYPDHRPLRTKTQAPLDLDQHRERHNVASDVQAALKANFESVTSPTSVERWLRLAIWWLVKSRIVSHILAQNGVQRRGTDVLHHQNRWHSTVSPEQAHTDLLKSSWILEEVVLPSATAEDLSYLLVRRLIKDLSLSIHNDLSERRSVEWHLEPSEENPPLKYNLHLLETFEQTIEAEDSVPAAIDDPIDAVRWFEIDQDKAGKQYEKVLFRTFVNAQLGSKYDRSKSPSAPYMLLLWTAADECDIFVSVCNQRGSVNLSRKLVAGDLENYEAGDDTTLFSIDFPTQEAEIKFLSYQDAVDFFAQPRLFFAALKDTKPRSGELAIYQASLSTYRDSSPNPVRTDGRVRTMASTKKSSCGLKIYESLPDKCWKTTRRLVLNTPPDSTKPESVSHWLPLQQIKMVVEGVKVTVRWSDCGQLEKEELGNYGSKYSYIYNADVPNRKIDLEFGSASEARKFEDCLLFPTELPPQVSIKTKITWDFQDIRIYRVEDADDPAQPYHSIALSRKHPKGPHMTEIYYVYQDLDWIISAKNGVPSTIDFPCLRTSHYVSTISRLTYKPDASDRPPEFSDVVEAFHAARFNVGCDHDLKRFMHGLTGWTLTFFRPLAKLHLVETGHLLRNPKEQYKGLSVQLWEKAAQEGESQIQLAVRLGDETKDRWITASLFGAPGRSEHSTMSYNVEYQALLIQRGVEVDLKFMTATTRGLKEQPASKKRWKMTLTFEETEHKDEFLRASGLVKMRVPYY